MYSVYKITNLINNKSYIGSSIRVEQRWKEHINSSKNSNDPKYNYPLYKAFRKYGLENFSFDIIADDFNTKEEMQLYENKMIIFYDSYNNGYNQTYNTLNGNIENLQKYIDKISQKCALIENNKIKETYKSYHDAAKQNNYLTDCASNIRNVCKGKVNSFNGKIFRDLDENNNIIIYKSQTSPRRNKVYSYNINTEEEKEYSSISEASKQTGLDRNRIQKCCSGDTRYSIIHSLIFRKIDENGNLKEIENFSILDVINKYNETNPVIDGKRKTIKEWCDFYNISKASYYARRKKGMGVIEALTTPKRR